MNPHTHTHTGCVCVDFFSLPFVPHGTLSAINADAGGGQRPLLRQQPSRRSFSLSLSMFLGLFRYSEAGRVRLSKRGAPVAQPFYLRPFIPSSDVLIGRRKQKSFFFFVFVFVGDSTPQRPRSNYERRAGSARIITPSEMDDVGKSSAKRGRPPPPPPPPRRDH